MSSPASTSDAAPSSAASSASPLFSSCPLLRSLRTDSDIQFHLLRFLILDEIGILARTHRLWGVWLDGDRALSKRYREVRASRLPRLLSCPWAMRPIDSISIKPERFDEEEEFKNLSLEERNQAQCDLLQQALRGIGRCFSQQLLELDFSVLASPKQDEFFDTCFASLSKLCWLRVDLPDTGGADSTLHHLFRGIEPLKTLKVLRFMGLIDQPQDVDLSVLPSLPLLEIFDTFCKCYDHHPTSEQLECISRCPVLTELGLGNWCAEDCLVSDRDADKSIEERLEAGIGCLVRRQQLADASPSNPPAVTSIEWFGTRMTSALWNHVSQLTSLETLFLGVWSAGMSAEQWAQLPRFTQLKDISIYPDMMEEDEVTSVIKIEEFLPSLVQCKTLEQIQLGEGLIVTSAHLESIARGLPCLYRLTLHRARVESLSPLVDSPSLSELSLVECTGVAAELVQFRVGSPALPLLQSLEIEDRADFVETPEQLAELNATIRAACPMLVTFTESVAPWIEPAEEPEEELEGELEEDQEDQPDEGPHDPNGPGPELQADPQNDGAEQ